MNNPENMGDNEKHPQMPFTYIRKNAFDFSDDEKTNENIFKKSDAIGFSSDEEKTRKKC